MPSYGVLCHSRQVDSVSIRFVSVVTDGKHVARKEWVRDAVILVGLLGPCSPLVDDDAARRIPAFITG